eukprot:SAG11_NODE_2272_length_3592_cov_2.048382_2_plen_112_part_00
MRVVRVALSDVRGGGVRMLAEALRRETNRPGAEVEFGFSPPLADAASAAALAHAAGAHTELKRCARLIQVGDQLNAPPVPRFQGSGRPRPGTVATSSNYLRRLLARAEGAL